MIVDAANGKGKIVPVRGGPQGSGIYFVGNGRTHLLEPPRSPLCGFVCQIGRATTMLLGCDSETSCVFQAATIFNPYSRCRIAAAAVRAAKAKALAWFAARAAFKYATRAEKLDHIFVAKHNLGPLVQRFGSREAVVRQMLRGIKGQTPASGVFETKTTIAGQTVVVRGAVVNGIVKIGTAFTP